MILELTDSEMEMVRLACTYLTADYYGDMATMRELQNNHLMFITDHIGDLTMIRAKVNEKCATKHC